jgi:hypothetical protein
MDKDDRGRIARPPLRCSDLETEAQAEFDLSRVTKLAVDETESSEILANSV